MVCTVLSHLDETIHHTFEGSYSEMEKGFAHSDTKSLAIRYWARSCAVGLWPTRTSTPAHSHLSAPFHNLQVWNLLSFCTSVFAAFEFLRTKITTKSTRMCGWKKGVCEKGMTPHDRDRKTLHTTHQLGLASLVRMQLHVMARIGKNWTSPCCRVPSLSTLETFAVLCKSAGIWLCEWKENSCLIDMLSGPWSSNTRDLKTLLWLSAGN